MKHARILFLAALCGLPLLLTACASDKEYGLCSTLGMCDEDPACKDDPGACSSESGGGEHSTVDSHAGGDHGSMDDQ